MCAEPSNDFNLCSTRLGIVVANANPDKRQELCCCGCESMEICSGFALGFLCVILYALVIQTGLWCLSAACQRDNAKANS
jgi:hypothetical protein